MQALPLEPSEADTLMSAATPRSRSKSAPARKFVEADVAALKMGDWYYFAILSLMETRSYRDTPAFIAQRLSLELQVVVEALALLEKVGMVARDSSGKRIPTPHQLKTSDHVASLCVRNNHLQGLELARRALHDDPVEQRNFSAMVMAIDPALLPEANKRITKFRRELCAFLESGDRREVFRMSIQLFSISPGK